MPVKPNQVTLTCCHSDFLFKQDVLYTNTQNQFAALQPFHGSTKLQVRTMILAMWCFFFEQRISEGALSPDGTVLATASHDGYVKFWQIYIEGLDQPRYVSYTGAYR